MTLPRWRSLLAPLFLSLLLLVTACAPAVPSRYEQVQQETTQRGAAPAVAKKAEQGSTFNQFFPKSVPGYQIVPAQEKKGFAEYKVNQDGKNVAMLSINDTTGTPAAEKYQQSKFDISGYPAVDQGMNATGILVNGRYQVKVLSREASFTRGDRVAWLEKFNLAGLAKLKPAAPTAALPATPRQAPSVTAVKVVKADPPAATVTTPTVVEPQPEIFPGEATTSPGTPMVEPGAIAPEATTLQSEPTQPQPEMPSAA